MEQRRDSESGSDCAQRVAEERLVGPTGCKAEDGMSGCYVW